MQRSGSEVSLAASPSALAYHGEKIIADLQALRDYFLTHTEGCILGSPTTPSAQAAGVGNTTWNINISVGMPTINGTCVTKAAAADVSIHAGSLLAGFTSGRSCIAAVVAYGSSATVLAVKGTPATTGAQVAPTQAEIQVAVDAASGVAATKWTKYGETTLNRTGDATVTQTYDSGKRPIPGVTENLGFGNWSTFAA